MDIIRNIIDDYENLIKTKITIPLDNGDTIRFAFHPQDLPHLLGLQHLVDNPTLFEYSQERLSATDLYNGMCGIGDKPIDIEAFEHSRYFGELYQNRIKYFSSTLILDIIKARQIVKFDSAKIKVFSTKLEKLEYMFWKKYSDENNNYGYFGLGFMASGKKSDINYPNTFFFRMDNQYICNQAKVIPLTFMMTDKYNHTTFEIYWDEIEKSMKKNSHYKHLNPAYLNEKDQIDIEAVCACKDNEIWKHYQFLKMDELDKIYLPYMNRDFRWSNNEKKFIIEKMKERKRDFYPNEIKMLLNEYKQIYNNSYNSYNCNLQLLI